MDKDIDDKLLDSIGNFVIEQVSSLGKNVLKSFLGINEDKIPEELITDLAMNTAKLINSFVDAVKE